MEADFRLVCVDVNAEYSNRDAQFQIPSGWRVSVVPLVDRLAEAFQIKTPPTDYRQIRWKLTTWGSYVTTAASSHGI